MNRTFWHLSALLLLTALVGPSASVATAADGCYRTEITADLRWISSAEWIAERGELAVVDPLQNSIFLISPKGKVERFDSSPIVDDPKRFVPATLARVQDGYLLKMVDARTFLLGPDLGRRSEVDIVHASSSTKGSVGSFYDSVSLESSLLVYGTVLEPKPGQRRTGFFQVPVKSARDFEFLLAHSAADYYLIGHHYITGLGRTGYFLTMGGEAELYEVPAAGRQLRKLKALPADYRHVPPFPAPSNGAASDEILFKQLEGFKVLVGVYGQGSFVFLLTREPGSSGGTVWKLHKIDPKRDVLVGSVTLPTSTNHLTLVPTKDWWFVFEKKAVHAGGQQDIPTLLALPTSSVQSLSLPASCPSPAK